MLSHIWPEASGNHLLKLMKALRMLRLLKLDSYISQLEDYLDANLRPLRLVQLVESQAFQFLSWMRPVFSIQQRVYTQQRYPRCLRWVTKRNSSY